MADEKKQPTPQTEAAAGEAKTKVSVEIPQFILEQIDAASKRHADCGRAVIIRMALYSFFGVKD